MIRCFAKSRRVFAAGLTITAALALYAAYRRAGGPLWVSVVSLTMTVGLGYVLSLLAARMTAASCDHAMLALLHLDLKPRAFVDAYAPAVRGMKPGSPARIIAAEALAEGFCALGDYPRALEALEEPGGDLPPKQRGALRALVLRSRCRCRLWSGDLPAARTAAAEFRDHVAALKSSNPRLAESMGRDAELYSLWLALLDGGRADLSELEKRMAEAPIKLVKLDICRVILLAAKNAGDSAAVERFQKVFADEGGELAFAVQLRRRMAETGA